jgi:hypothetical protein
MSNNLSTFQKFADITAAKEFAALLEQENIYYEIVIYN